ncbi:MAG: asparagine synthase (glutamine-hydrolyzing) [Sporichthyaceae bacterium]
MCGIVGTYNLPVSNEALAAMSRAVAHRGPDSEGFYSKQGAGGRIALGHRRLSIIDLSSAADQPFLKDGLALVFNGEIYNYRDLRQELSDSGVRFRTNSDTEVLLEAWRRWGPKCLGRLRGMFAFALYDERTEELALVRDAFGIKPLFYTARDGGVAFASELKGLRPIVGPPEIDASAVVASLLYSWIPDSRCVWRGVRKLEAGTWLQVTPRGNRLQTWWDPQKELLSAEEPAPTVEELRTVLADSVAAHMVADVPVGAFLSGGLDSSLLSVLAAEHTSNIHAYTVSFRPQDKRFEAMPDDLVHARRVAADHGMTLHEVQVAPDVSDLLPDMVRILDEPIGDAAAINAYLICAAAREAGVKVLLSGMGADELFAGYRKHYACLLAGRYSRLPAPARHAVRGCVGRLPVANDRRGYRSVRWAKRFLSFAELPEESAFLRSYTHYDVRGLRGLLTPELWPLIDDLVEEHADVYRQGPPDDQVNRMCFTDTRLFLTGLNLAYTDRASMAASTEVRVPFVDHAVVRAAFAIPGDRKIVGRRGKVALKEAAELWLPKQIVHRPKALFSAPLRAWVRRDLQEMVENLVARGSLVTSGMVDKSRVRSMIDEDRVGVADWSKEIWQLLTLEEWYQQHTAVRTEESV